MYVKQVCKMNSQNVTKKKSINKTIQKLFTYILHYNSKSTGGKKQSVKREKL